MTSNSIKIVLINNYFIEKQQKVAHSAIGFAHCINHDLTMICSLSHKSGVQAIYQGKIKQITL